MTEVNKVNVNQTEEMELAECNGQLLEQTKPIEEMNAMFDLKEKIVFADRTYKTEHELNRFLATLSDTQRAHAEVIADDDTFVVFYPRLRQPAARKSGYHFDTDSVRPAQIEAGVGGWTSELAPHSPDRAAGLAILLASVQL